jgi:VWFA-related protein
MPPNSEAILLPTAGPAGASGGVQAAKKGYACCMSALARPLQILLIAASSLLARQEPTIRVDVQQVLVPVVVTDKKGHHVSGLHAADFRIFEDGVQQQIASFSADTSNSAGDIGALSKPASAGAPQAAGARHTFVICIDTLHASPASALRTRAALENLFEKEKPADAQYVLIGIGRQLQVLQPATTNPLAMLVKIRGAAFQTALGGLDAAALSAQLQNVRIRMDEFCRRCACGARAGSRNDCTSEIDTLKQSIDAQAERWTAPLGGLLEQFKSVVEELAKLPTGRTLILVSDGFNVNPKREFYAAVSAYLPNSPQFKLDDSADADPGLRAALEVSTERNVIVDAIDSRTGETPALATGGPMDASAPAAISGGDMLGTTRSTAQPVRSTSVQSAPGRASPLAPEESATMERLARATGGIYLHASGDLLKQFRGALAEGREYYLLAYVPKKAEGTASAPGKFHSITVETTDKKLNIRAKPGYWAAAGAAQ